MINGLDKLGKGSQTGWAQAGKLITQNSSGTVSLQCAFPSTSVFCVQIDCNLPSTGAVPKITVSWSTNGVTTSRVIDCAAGTSISGVADSVRVLAQDATPGTLAAGVSYDVTLSVGLFSRPPSAISPTVTGLRNAVVNNGATEIIPVPPGANGFYLFFYPDSSSTISLIVAQTTVADISNPAVTLTGYLQTEGAPEEPIPLMAGARELQVLNQTGVNGHMSCVFTIDG